MQQDNIYKQIPLVQRIGLELDIQGAVSSGTFTVARDLLPKIRALNLIRCILDEKPSYQSSVKSVKSPEILIWVILYFFNIIKIYFISGSPIFLFAKYINHVTFSSIFY